MLYKIFIKFKKVLNTFRNNIINNNKYIYKLIIKYNHVNKPLIFVENC